MTQNNFNVLQEQESLGNNYIAKHDIITRADLDELEKVSKLDEYFDLPRLAYKCNRMDVLYYLHIVLEMKMDKIYLSKIQKKRIDNIAATYKYRSKRKTFIPPNNILELRKMFDDGTIGLDDITETLYRSNEMECRLYFSYKRRRGEVKVHYHDNVPKIWEKMGIVCFADVHGRMDEFKIPDAKILIFAGDLCTRGNFEETKKFLMWFANLPHQHKIIVPGNHDYFLEDIDYDPKKVRNYPFLKSDKFKKVHVLVGKGVEIDGIKIFGHPCIPYRSMARSNAFAICRRDMSKMVNIPTDPDILVTHFPAWGIGDGNTALTCDKTVDSGDL